MPNTELTETPKRKFIIDRSKWRCAGHGKGRTYLLNDAGYRCCLGFVSSQCGVPDEKLLYVGSPISSMKEQLEGVLLVQGCENDLTSSAISLNDNESLSREERERELIKLFLKEGFELEFTGEYESGRKRECLAQFQM